MRITSNVFYRAARLSISLTAAIAGAQATEGPPDRSSDAATKPTITVTRLDQICEAYNAIKMDPIAAGSFNVSADGRHYAVVRSTGLDTEAVVIDGKAGPNLRGVETRLTLSPDFNVALYHATALDDTEDNRLWVQSTDRNIWSSPDGGVRNSHRQWIPNNWSPVSSVGQKVICNSELTPFLKRKVGDLFILKLGEDGPELGPFGERYSFSFDPSGKHCLLFGLVPIANGKALEHVVYLDGKRILKDYSLPAYHGQMDMPGEYGSVAVVSPSGSYALYIYGKLIKDGKEIFSDSSWPPLPAFGSKHRLRNVTLSPDGSRIAYSILGQNGVEAAVDGKPQAIARNVWDLCFSGDSKTFAYVRDGVVCVDGVAQTDPMDPRSSSHLICGPKQGEFAYFADGQKFVLSGRATPVSSAVQLNVSFPMRFTSDGLHVIGVSQKPAVILDGQSFAIPGSAVSVLAETELTPRHFQFLISRNQRPSLEFCELDFDF